MINKSRIPELYSMIHLLIYSKTMQDIDLFYMLAVKTFYEDLKILQ